MSLLLICLGMTAAAYAQGSQGYEGAHDPKVTLAQAAASPNTLQRINAGYVARVKPIFDKKCMDCHGNRTNYPWYYKIPGIKQLIDHDIKEAKEHLDFSGDFPFNGKFDDEEDLKEIKEVVEEGEMPIFLYRVMHPGSQLTDGEKKIVTEWADEGLKLLSSP